MSPFSWTHTPTTRWCGSLAPGSTSMPMPSSSWRGFLMCSFHITAPVMKRPG
uniref:Alternative protein PTGIS n=1 Tax=Homo sapiens TaxID=9606 RepID=L8EC60_HUMAN|nr:alternative protein PTGIS [Homo sapiens]